MIVIPASLRSDFIHMTGMTIHIALESTIHIVGIRSCSEKDSASAHFDLEPSLYRSRNGYYLETAFPNR
jgi:hypothetical protein